MGHLPGQAGGAAGEQGKEVLYQRPSRYGLHTSFSAQGRKKDSMLLLLWEQISKRKRKRKS